MNGNGNLVRNILLYFFVPLMMAGVWLGAPTKAQAQGHCSPPNLLIILDRSGSMGSYSKWTNAKSAIYTITTQYYGKVRFGLELFSSSALIPTVRGNCQIASTPKIIRDTLNYYSASGGTYMVKAMTTARTEIIRAIRADHSAGIYGRRNALMFITDGSPSDRCPTSEASALRSLSVDGRTYDVRTYVIGFGSGVNTSCLNSLANAGGTNRCTISGCTRYYVASNQNDMTKAMDTIIRITTQETCNNRDDDCDGQIDENLSRSCYTGPSGTAGKGICQNGTQTCSRGNWGSCSGQVLPTSERCDGIDNDCDGRTDENWPNKGQRCTSGTGACAKTGTYICKSDGSGVRCSVTGGTPSPEVCDNRDNDCDGRIDENLSRSCYTGPSGTAGKGICHGGTQTCSAGRWSSCSGQVLPKSESCNNQDDDCDGRIDEGLRRACYSGPAGTEGKGICHGGTQTCSAGRWGSCSGQVLPTSERCDGIDNDCDGRTDENWSNKGQSCSAGTGACKQTGKYVCKSDGSGTKCSVKGGKPSPEKCDNIDNDCDGKVDEGDPEGGGNCNTTKKGICRPGTLHCRNGKLVCESNKTPQKEACNGQDDDCDGSTDEDFPQKGQPCTSGVGQCKRTGKYIYKKDGSGVECSVTGTKPEPEKCDNIDNDCDGQIDENLTQVCKTICNTGMEVCKAGNWEGCTARKPSKEICDGLDNDCNGKVDDGLTRKCSTKCGDGTEKCVRGKWVFCDAQKPEPEKCDGLDNDCNGKVDDGIPPKTCQGACGQGTAVCQNGKWSGCSGPQPENEKCDGLDNDCNGKIDDGLTRKCTTACGDGVEKCDNGKWKSCSAPTPQPEVCDGKDNDCDGKPDNGAKCPAGMVCKEGACRPLCSSGECPKGMQCVDGICMGDPCKTKKCPPGKKCIGGQCIDPCDTINCPGDQVCQNGQCVKKDCYVNGCPTGERCVNGKCEADPCQGKKCADGEFCRDGKCVGVCAEVQCKSDEKCVDGQCEKLTPKEEACAGVKCPAGEICKEGKCVGDPCKDVTCPDGRRCAEGQCEHDPCLNIQCPAGSTCRDGQCIAKSEDPNAEATTPPDGSTQHEKTTAPDGGSKEGGGAYEQTDPGKRRDIGGCVCSLPHTPTQAPLWLLAALFFLIALRRRQR